MRIRLIAPLAVAACLACSGAPKPPLLEELDRAPVSIERRRWPEPPETPRIEFLGEIGSERAFTRRSSVRRWIAKLITGNDGLRFVRPAALCLEGSVLAVSDPGLGAVHRIDLEGRRWDLLGGRRYRELRSPVGVACLPDGRFVVADSQLGRLFAFAADGKPLGGFGPASLDRPTGLAVDRDRSRLWVAETHGNRVRALDFAGRELTSFGIPGSEPGALNAPTALAASPDGGVWVTDALNFRLQRFDEAGRFVGAFGAAGDAPGSFARPRGIALADQGRIFVVDALFDAVQIFDATGQLLLIFGGRGDGPGQLWLPADVILGARSHVFVSDSYNRRVLIYAYHPPEEGSQ
jgi:hypothetical protein